MPPPARPPQEKMFAAPSLRHPSRFRQPCVCVTIISFQFTKWAALNQPTYQRTDNKHSSFLLDMLGLGDEVKLLTRNVPVLAITTCFGLNRDQVLPEVATTSINCQAIPIRGSDRDSASSDYCGLVDWMGLCCCFEVEFFPGTVNWRAIGAIFD
ncbi:MAG: hypothetical protein LQ337_002495 [Flavoplaca oasis]|nr:MAG: hypothetical protein LQ337_002495 [Flavoplaca oasis]